MVAEEGLHYTGHVPAKVHRHALLRPPRKRRLCLDDRNYVFVPYTIQGTVTTGDFEPAWQVDRDYWIARVTASIGRHDSATHPDDGCPQGSALQLNVRRVRGDNDVAILATDAKIQITENHHRDNANSTENGTLTESDFNYSELAEGDSVYVRVTQVGSTSAGRALTVTLVLVPVR